MVNLGVNVQPLTVLPGEWETIKRQYPAGILAIIDWPASVAAIPADANVTLWRFTQDPRGLPGWPGALVARCKLAVFANEPDLEGWPAWYAEVCRAWRAAGGTLVAPAYHDERATVTLPYGAGSYDVVSWHGYAGNLENRTALRDLGEDPMIGTEYGRAHAQGRCLDDLEAAGVTETVYLFAWRWQGNASAGYDLAGVTIAQPTPATPATPTSYDPVAGLWQQASANAHYPIPMNPSAAIYRAWRDVYRLVGVPISREQAIPGVGTVQYFCNAVAVWDGSKVEWS